MVTDERRAEVREAAERQAVERVIDVLHPETRATATATGRQSVRGDARLDLRQRSQQTQPRTAARRAARSPRRSSIREQTRAEIERGFYDVRLDRDRSRGNAVAADRRHRRHGPSGRAATIWARCSAALLPKRKTPQARHRGGGAAHLRAGGSSEAHRHGRRQARSAAARRRERHHLHRRDRQGRRPRGRARRPRRFARRRAARHPADRRRLDGQHEVRTDQDRSRPVHRRRRVSHEQAVGSDSGAARALSDSRRARLADRRGFQDDSHAAEATR